MSGRQPAGALLSAITHLYAATRMRGLGTSRPIRISPDSGKLTTSRYARRGQGVDDCARALLEERLTNLPQPEITAAERRDAVWAYRGLPRRSEADLAELAREQGAPLSVDWDNLPQDPEPESESCDEFLEWLREVRRDH